jgi:hypothetical protein
MNVPTLQKWLAEPRTALITAVADGVRSHVGTLRSRGIEFYGYALLPGEPYDIQSLVAVTNAEADIKVPPSDSQYNYYRYCVEEWVRWEYEGFAAANALLVEADEVFRSMHSKPDGDFRLDEFEIAHVNILLDSIVQGLQAAKASGVFGGSKPFLVVWISDSNHKIMTESVRRLNPTEVATDFAREFGS